MTKYDDMADIVSIRRMHEARIYETARFYETGRSGGILDQPYSAWLLACYARRGDEEVVALVREGLLELARTSTREYVTLSGKALAHLHQAAVNSNLSDYSFYGPWLFSADRPIWTSRWLDPNDDNPYKIAIEKLDLAASVVGGDFFIRAVNTCAYVADELATETDVRTGDTKLFARYVDRCLINTYTPSIVDKEWVPNRKELGVLLESLLKIYGVTNHPAIKELTVDINRILHPKAF